MTTTVTGLTASKMQQLADENVVGGSVSSGNLVLSQRGGGTINAGSVIGPAGATGPQGPAGSANFTTCTSGTRPSSPTTGQVIYETDTHRQYMWSGSVWRWIAGNPPSVKLKGVNNLSVPAGTFTTIPFGTSTEVFDTDNFHDMISNNTRITIPTGWDGLYDIGGTIQWDQGAGGLRRFMIIINGTLLNVLAITDNNQVNWGSIGGGQTLATQARLVAGDYLELCVLHSFSSSTTILGIGTGINSTPPLFWATLRDLL